jgi:acyl carrier protein
VEVAVAETDVFERVVKIIKPFAKNQEALAQVGPDTKILDDLKVNSARLVDIILELENEFEIELGDEDADKVRTVGDAVGIIAAKKG